MKGISMEIEFIVHGEPYGKGRPRFRPSGQPYTPAKTVKYEKLVQLEYNSQAGGKCFNDNVLLEMRVYAYYTIPKNTPQWKIPLMLSGAIRPLKKPDWDNVGKTIADSLNKIAYHDDAQIVDGMVRKFYSDNPRVEVKICEAEGYSPKLTKMELRSMRKEV